MSALTQNDFAEARAYIERSLNDQAKLGYSRPPKPVIEKAVAETAQAIHKLKSLSTSSTPQSQEAEADHHDTFSELGK